MDSLKAALSAFERIHGLKKLNDKTKKAYTAILDTAIADLRAAMPLVKYEWQNELVTHLYHYLVKDKLPHMVVAVGTGHGKSVLI